ncbi:MAG TPA: Fic/DOC family N-terminal domain-containing protein [Fimbriimonadaceae bacterium]|nr:Fic/DOC family N-terminal domain-containing protein [Fimbriimonadaceae bacterium]
MSKYGRFFDTSSHNVYVMNISGDDDSQMTLPLASGFDRETPYNALPVLPPKRDLETVRTLKKAIGANKALAELRGIGQLIPYQGVLIRAIVLQEAKLSSEIENIVTTNDQLYRGFSDDPSESDPSTKEVLRYEEALWCGFQHLRNGRPLSASLFVELVQIIKQASIGIRTMPGTQIVNERTRAPIYTPPVGELFIRRLLDNLSDFLYATDPTDPLIKMAVAHYQFEAIHPFSDGNGRTGRVLNILYLVDRGLLDLPVLYLSRHILEHKADYYSGLRQVTEEGSWEDWIVYMLEALEVTAIDTRNRVLQIRQALDTAIAEAKAKMSRGYSKELIELVFEQPYSRIRFLESRNIAKRQTASEYLKELHRIGLLRPIKRGRELYYVNDTLMKILTR